MHTTQEVIGKTCKSAVARWSSTIPPMLGTPLDLAAGLRWRCIIARDSSKYDVGFALVIGGSSTAQHSTATGSRKREQHSNALFLFLAAAGAPRTAIHEWSSRQLAAPRVHQAGMHPWRQECVQQPAASQDMDGWMDLLHVASGRRRA